MAKVFVVFSTIDSKESAEKIAHDIVKQQLAACVNIIANITSIYKWKGKVEHEAEHLMVVKTSENCLPNLMERIKELHPYEVPEVIALSIDEGDPAYLEWILSETRENSP